MNRSQSETDLTHLRNCKCVDELIRGVYLTNKCWNCKKELSMVKHVGPANICETCNKEHLARHEKTVQYLANRTQTENLCRTNLPVPWVQF